MMFKRCDECGAGVLVLKDCKCNCGITCCDKPMRELKANTTDGAVEKHKPMYNIVGENMEVYVNHVMEDDHYIEWIRVVWNNEEYTKYFKPGDEPKIIVPYKSGAKLYSYCNKHLFWVSTVE